MERTSSLRSYREAHSLTLEELSAQIGVNKTTLLRWEDGSVLIPHERVLMIEHVTGISRHELRPDLSDIFGPAPQPNEGQAA